VTGTLELVAPRALLVPRPRVRLELQPGDRVIAEIGDVVRAGDVLAERIRDARLVEVVLPRHAADQGVPLPGTWLPGEHAQPGRRAATPAGELLFQHGGRRRLATGHHPDHLSAPADGRLVEVHAALRSCSRSAGRAWSRPSCSGSRMAGRLVLLPEGSDPHLALDVALAGAVVVMPGRVDAEALTRARAMGVRGAVVGSLAERDRRDLAASAAASRPARTTWRPSACSCSVAISDGPSLRRSRPSWRRSPGRWSGPSAILRCCSCRRTGCCRSRSLTASSSGVARRRAAEGRWLGPGGPRRMRGGVVVETGW